MTTSPLKNVSISHEYEVVPLWNVADMHAAPPTIADLQSQGVHGARAFCLNQACQRLLGYSIRCAAERRRDSFYPLGEVPALRLFGMRLARRASIGRLCGAAPNRQGHRLSNLPKWVCR